MKVKTRVEHGNGYGDKYLKAKGDEYEVPDVHAKPLIAAGLVEDPNAPAPRPARRRAKKPAAARAAVPAPSDRPEMVAADKSGDNGADG